jgi:hypothetical protein
MKHNKARSPTAQHSTRTTGVDAGGGGRAPVFALAPALPVAAAAPAAAATALAAGVKGKTRSTLGKWHGTARHGMACEVCVKCGRARALGQWHGASFIIITMTTIVMNPLTCAPPPRPLW